MLQSDESDKLSDAKDLLCDDHPLCFAEIAPDMTARSGVMWWGQETLNQQGEETPIIVVLRAAGPVRISQYYTIFQHAVILLLRPLHPRALPTLKSKGSRAHYPEEGFKHGSFLFKTRDDVVWDLETHPHILLEHPVADTYFRLWLSCETKCIIVGCGCRNIVPTKKCQKHARDCPSVHLPIQSYLVAVNARIYYKCGSASCPPARTTSTCYKSQNFTVFLDKCSQDRISFLQFLSTSVVYMLNIAVGNVPHVYDKSRWFFDRVAPDTMKWNLYNRQLDNSTS